MLANIEMTSRKSLMRQQPVVEVNHPNGVEEQFSDILRNRVEQLGPALDDEAAAAYAATLLQMVEPVAPNGTQTRQTHTPSFVDEESGYLVVGDTPLTEAAPAHFGPAIDDEESAGYMSQFLG